MSHPPSLFFVEGDAVVIDLSKVAYAQTHLEPDASNSDATFQTMLIHFVGGPTLRLYETEEQRSFLVALATYHELYVSP